MQMPLAHLDGWLRGPQARQWGFARYAVMLQLYVWLELALRRRYPDSLDRQVVRVDRAFARFSLGKNESVARDRLDRQSDAVRKIRVRMDERLAERRAMAETQN